MKNTTASSSLSFGLTGLLALTGCVGTSDSALPEKTAPETLSVVVTTTILGSVVRDIVTCVAGDDAGLSVIMPIGVDPHDFQASSEQVALMVGADLTVVNGLGLEAGSSPRLNVERGRQPYLRGCGRSQPVAFR